MFHWVAKPSLSPSREVNLSFGVAPRILDVEGKLRVNGWLVAIAKGYEVRREGRAELINRRRSRNDSANPGERRGFSVLHAYEAAPPISSMRRFCEIVSFAWTKRASPGGRKRFQNRVWSIGCYKCRSFERRLSCPSSVLLLSFKAWEYKFPNLKAS